MPRQMLSFIIAADGEIATLDVSGDPVFAEYAPHNPDEVEVFVELDTGTPRVPRHFRCYTTGEYLPLGAKYIATLPRDPYGKTVHLYELTPHGTKTDWKEA